MSSAWLILDDFANWGEIAPDEPIAIRLRLVLLDGDRWRCTCNCLLLMLALYATLRALGQCGGGHHHHSRRINDSGNTLRDILSTLRDLEAHAATSARLRI